MPPDTRVALVACLLLVGSGATAVVGAQSGGTTITDVAYAGQGDVDVPGERLHLWQSDPHEFAVTVDTGEGVPSGELCLVVLDDGSGTRLDCRSVSLSPNRVETITVAVSNWPGNATGQRRLDVRLLERESGDPIATRDIAVTVIRRDGDLDLDGLTNQREVDVGTSLTAGDTDGDGLDDRIEVTTYDTDPTASDTDGDGLDDGSEVRTVRTDPTASDTDGDGLPDGAEVNVHDTDPNRRDTDGDRLADAAEVNTYQTDATAADTDGDGLGDGAEVEDLGTDPTGPDTDGDGLDDGRERTIFLTDPTVADTDDDGLDDDAEVSVHRTDPTVADTDGDGLDDGAEVETHGTAPNAADTDSDGVPDGVELRRGSDPTEPTVTDGGPLQGLVAFVARRTALVVGIGVVGAAVVVVAYWRDATFARSALGDRLGRGADAGLERTVGTNAGTGATVDTDAEPDADTPTDAPVDVDTTVDSASDGTGASAEPGAAADEGVTVVTNEERVHRLLGESGGRMLQSEMVEAADWSKATVSRVLTQMEENGDVTRVDIGRGNLVTLPNEEPDGASSGLTDE